MNFMERKFKNVKLTERQASAAAAAAKSYPIILKGIIEEGGYSKDQIVYLDETELSWKVMPKSTYTARQQKQATGQDVDQSRFNVMLCLNLSGTCKMKPVVVHAAEHPHCYNHVRSMEDVDGFYWYHSHDRWMTSNNYEDLADQQLYS